MTQYEMTEKLAEKCDVTLEEAKTALENGDWNMLTATHLLEQEKFSRMQALNEAASTGAATAVQFAPDEGTWEAPEAQAQAATEETVKETVKRVEARHRANRQGARKLGALIRRAVAWGNRNRFEVHKGGERLLDVPVTALVLAMVCAFWVCVPLLVVGLFMGCRYSVGGREFGLSKADAGSATQA